LIARLGLTLVLALYAIMSPRFAGAQEVATSFDQLAGQLKPGAALVVTDTRGTTFKGKLVGLAGSSLDLTVGNDRFTPSLRILESDVNNVVTTRADRLWDGPLIGFAIGVGVATLVELATSNEYSKFQGGSVVGLGVFGMATGFGIDLFNRQKVVVYVRPRN